jgi:2-(1,2-epoxy-1,2-dihydrophenyl)acetyl-CoA isomerase
MNDFITIRPSLPEQVATLARDNSSKRNALYPEMRVGIARVAAHLRRNRDIRARIVTGASGHFCWGGDLRNIATGGLDNEGWPNHLQDLPL